MYPAQNGAARTSSLLFRIHARIARIWASPNGMPVGTHWPGPVIGL
jgi:hypothetical protein